MRRNAGLTRQSLKMARGGAVCCVLPDDGRADLRQPAHGFGRSVIPERWTVQAAF